MTEASDKMFQTICGMVYCSDGSLTKAEWQRIFKDALSNAFGSDDESGEATD